MASLDSPGPLDSLDSPDSPDSRDPGGLLAQDSLDARASLAFLGLPELTIELAMELAIEEAMELAMELP